MLMKQSRTDDFKSYMFAVGAALRDVEFCLTGSNTAYVYRKGDSHALGAISKRCMSNNGGDITYVVMSRLIENQKYRESTWQSNALHTKKMDRAVKTAATYLRPYSCTEAVEDTVREARSLTDNLINNQTTKVRNAYREFTGVTAYVSDMQASPLIQELRYRQFDSPELQVAADNFYKTFDEFAELGRLQERPLTFVRLNGSEDDATFDWVEVPYGVHLFANLRTSEGNPMDAMPNWMKGRLSVLHMLQPSNIVSGVGVKIDDRMYYINEEE
jgi:hypothetical protein